MNTQLVDAKHMVECCLIFLRENHPLKPKLDRSTFSTDMKIRKVIQTIDRSVKLSSNIMLFTDSEHYSFHGFRRLFTLMISGEWDCDSVSKARGMGYDKECKTGVESNARSHPEHRDVNWLSQDGWTQRYEYVRHPLRRRSHSGHRNFGVIWWYAAFAYSWIWVYPRIFRHTLGHQPHHAK